MVARKEGVDFLKTKLSLYGSMSMLAFTHKSALIIGCAATTETPAAILGLLHPAPAFLASGVRLTQISSQTIPEIIIILLIELHYRLPVRIDKQNMDTAEKFECWIFDEVLR